MRGRWETLGALLPSDAAALVAADHNVGYLTGFFAGDSYVLVTRERCWFLTDFRYMEMARQSVMGVSFAQITRLTDTLKELLDRHGVRTLFVEAEEMTVSFVTRLRRTLDTVQIEDGGNLDKWLSTLREVKDEREVAAILQAQALAEEGFTHILSYIREGVTERDVALELEMYMRRRGAQRVAFDTIVVSGANTSLPHGVPGDKPICRGDFITMDFGAVIDGYHSDMTRTVALGCVSDEQRTVYDTVLRAQEAALSTLKAGITGCAGDAAARSVIEQAGYGAAFGHATGHGVGVQIHEEPRLSARNEEPLKAGQIVTVEPGIYLEGRFGVRIEDMVQLTTDGCRNLTKSPKELLII